MSIASGFSIQRNDVIQVPHRQQYESHDAISGDRIYLLRSLPDYEDKNWDWDIRMGEVRIHLERGAAALAVNGNNTTSTALVQPEFTIQKKWHGTQMHIQKGLLQQD